LVKINVFKIYKEMEKIVLRKDLRGVSSTLSKLYRSENDCVYAQGRCGVYCRRFHAFASDHFDVRSMRNNGYEIKIVSDDVEFLNSI
jgi:hypothetical protein